MPRRRGTPHEVVGARRLEAALDRDRCSPDLVVVGDEDRLTPPAMARSIADAIPGARLAVIPAAGHLSNIEQPAAFNAAVLGFLASVS
jgi:pimeloyl-ACP methyl ester carboxylesterase